METVLVYAICIASVFATFLLFTFRLHILQFVKYVVLLLCKVLTYPQILRRHSLLGPWTPVGFIVYTAYIATNVYCLEFWKLTGVKVGLRASNRP